MAQEWELNKGSIVRSYASHTGQLSSIRFRPSSTLPIYPVASPPKIAAPPTFNERRRGSLGSDNSLESLFGDESPGGMNEVLMDEVIDNKDHNDAHALQEPVVPEEPQAEQQACKDVFLTSSIDGTITLWDRRREGMVARLAPGPRGTPPWCMSVFLFVFLSYIRLAGVRMGILFMQVDEMERWMNIQCINPPVHLSEHFDSQGTQEKSEQFKPCQMAKISFGNVSLVS